MGSLRKMRARNVINLALVSSSSLFAGISLSLLLPFFPDEALLKGVSVTQSGVVMSSVFVTTIICTPLFGKYIDLLGARLFLIVGSFVVAIGNIVFGFIDRIEDKNVFFALAIVIRIFTAIGESALVPSSYPLAGRQVTKENQGKAIALIESCFGIRTMFGPSIGGLLFDYGGFPLPFFVTGGITLGVAAVMLVLLKDNPTEETAVSHGSNQVTWMQILKADGVFMSFFVLTFAGSSWAWFSSSLGPFLTDEFSSSSTTIGLVFMAFGCAYTVFTPIFGYMTDKGLDGMIAMLIGNTLIAIAFTILGPIPPFKAISGHLWLTVFSLVLQGIGSAATYLGSLLYMMKSILAAGLPDNDQSNGMVSSLWIVGDCAGGFFGSLLGGVAYDAFGFETGTLFEFGLICFTVLLITIYIFVKR